MINPNNLTHRAQERHKRSLIPKLPWESGYTNPLIHFGNSVIERIKERYPRLKDEIETINKPRAISIDQVPIFRISKPDKDPIIANINKGSLTFEERPILFGFIDYGS